MHNFMGARVVQGVGVTVQDIFRTRESHLAIFGLKH